MYYTTNYDSPIGRFLLASDGENLVGLWMENQKYYRKGITGEIIENNDLSIFKDTKKWLDKYFSGKKPNISEINLSPIGGDFRQSVWKILCEIPYGEVITYGDIAKKLAKKMNKSSMSSQAVGGAVGHNPISIIIPCHRVVGSNGSFTGFAGGINKKIQLLDLEGIDTTKFSIPKKGSAL